MKSRYQSWRLLVCVLIFLIVLALGWSFGTSHGKKIRLLAADSLLTTRHGDWAVLLLGKAGKEAREAAYMRQFDRMGAVLGGDQTVVRPSAASGIASPIRVEQIRGKPYKGYLLYVPDPKKLRLGVPKSADIGETVSSMAKRTGAIAGVNAGGFSDPAHMGDGALPTGIVISGGKLLYNSEDHDLPSHIVGIDIDGRLLAGKYSPDELIALHVREAVTFAPRFIAGGAGLIEKPEDGWGLAPRTAVGQLEDGTIVFAVIDGRQLHSIGASLYDLQQLFLELGAVTAANLDGGASTELVYEGEVLNKPATRLGERPIPTAWLVYENPEEVPVINPWVQVLPQ